MTNSSDDDYQARFLNEVVNLGGLPVTRKTAYDLVLLQTGDKAAADYAAYSSTRKPIDAGPLSFEEAKREIDAADPGETLQ